MSHDERQSPERLDAALVEAFAESFLNTRDYYPEQLEDGSYVARKAPISMPLVEQHLRGYRTIGAYALDSNSLARWLCFDGDDEGSWSELKALALDLASQGQPAYLEQSRRGGHLWVFFGEPLPGRLVRQFGRGLLQQTDAQLIKEIYPRQDKLQTGPGSLVRLPLGIHRKSMRRYGFVTLEGQPLAASVREQLAFIAAPDTVSGDFVRQFVARLPDDPPPYQPTELRTLYTGDGGLLSERIKRAVTVPQFVAQYVDLDGRGRGLCPFHDDHRESFGVSHEHNFWS
ncbi:MAG: hypothetical protein KC547_05640, partial [Anaerolineae bacterium]|nr:hypothetical protein [Anaerolineae bacterium]